MEEKITVNLSDSKSPVHELTILKGKAREPKNIRPVSIVGRIDSPGNYWEGRKDWIVEQDAHVETSYEKRFIKLIINPDIEQLTVGVTGNLNLDPRLEKFQINTPEKRYTRDELSRICKFNRSYFSPIEAGTNLVAKLRDYKMKFEQALENSDNQRGNKKILIEKSIKECELPANFTLNLPVFQGGDPVKIDVELLFDVDAVGDVHFYLESVALADIIEKEVRERIDKEIKRFGSLVIIYQ